MINTCLWDNAPKLFLKSDVKKFTTLAGKAAFCVSVCIQKVLKRKTFPVKKLFDPK
jgi:hypothetical protein